MTLQKREGLKVGDVGSLNFYFFFGLGFERWVSFFGWEDLLVERSWCWFFFLLLRGEQTWQWKIPIVNREYIFKRSIFHCHLSLRRLYRYAFHIHISSLTFLFSIPDVLRRHYCTQGTTTHATWSPAFWNWIWYAGNNHVPFVIIRNHPKDTRMNYI